jgi:hypothetical protein
MDSVLTNEAAPYFSNETPSGLFQACNAAVDGQTIPIYRNANGFCTHMDSLTAGENGTIADNNGQPYYYGFTSQVPGTVPVYRMNFAGTDDYMMTLDATEGTAAGYTIDNNGTPYFYAYPTNPPTTTSTSTAPT